MNLKPLKLDAWKLLGTITRDRPYSRMIPKEGQKHLRNLTKRGFIIVTGEGSQWERLFPTQAGSMFLEWQRAKAMSEIMAAVGATNK